MTNGQHNEGDKAHNRNAWIVLVVVLLVGISMAWQQIKVQPVVDLVANDLNVDKATVGWISGVFSLTGLFLALPAVGIIKKIGILKSGVLSVVITLLGSIMGLFSPNQYVLLGSRIVEGTGIGLVSVIGPSVVSMWFPLEKRGGPMAIWSSWSLIALACGFFLNRIICGVFGGWKGMWIVGIILLLIGLIAILWKLRTPPAESNYADVEDTTVRMSEILHYRSVYLMALGGMSFGLALISFGTWVVTFWSTEGGLDVGFASNIMAWIYLGEIVTTIIAGFILDKVKNRKRFVIINAIVYSIVFFAAFSLNSFEAIVVIAVLYAVCEGLFAGSMWTLATQVIPDPRLTSTSLAIFSMGMSLGAVFGAAMSGTLIDSFGWVAVAIFTAACLLISACLFGTLTLYDQNGKVLNGHHDK